MNSIRVSLPGELKLHCAACTAEFSMRSRAISGAARLHCPLCGKQAELYDMLEPQLRRKVYHAVRELMEQRVLEQKAMDSAGYFEDELNASA